MNKNFDLSGKWEFTCRPEGRVAGMECPENFPGFMMIPGFWDEHYELFDYTDDFDRNAKFNPEYRKLHFPMGQVAPDASKPFIIGTGYYRKNLKLSGIAGCRAILTVGPAVWGSEVFCNGKSAGYNSGYSTGYEYDISELICEGDNEIIIAVSNCNRGKVMDTNNGQHRGCAVRGFKSTRAGISRGVSLKIIQAAAIGDNCTALIDGKLYFYAEVTGSAAILLRRRISRDGAVVFEDTLPIPADGRISVFNDAPQLPRWSDDQPQLCKMELELLDAGGNILDELLQECGFAEMTVDGFDLLLNGIPKFLRGSTEHCYYPESCTPHCDTDKYLRDLGVLRSAGFNFMRCHTWTPPEEFFIACDRLGMVVQLEVPPNTVPDEWRAILRMARKHVSARILCGGNEENLTAARIAALRELQKNMKDLAPWMLFNPQEALPLAEYRLDAIPAEELHEGDIVDEPYPHNIRKFAEIAEFSDLYGGFSQGYASYIFDEFPKVEFMEKNLAVYGKPCLSHEAGILGGYIDLSLEKRYAGTYISPELYATIREYQAANGVSYERSQYFYDLNSRYIAVLRKQLLENLRRCPTLRGYDFLGGVDAHWHRSGYPCGVFNEFYEEKPGETAASFLRCNGESVLLCDAGFQRNYCANSQFEQTVSVSYFGETLRRDAVLKWSFKAGDFVCSGEIAVPELVPGRVIELGCVRFILPDTADAVEGILACELEQEDFRIDNQWSFWCYPQINSAPLPQNVAIASALGKSELEFIVNGGRLLLADNFPSDCSEENFRTCCTGRSNGHYGFYVNSHPAMDKFPHNGFLEMQIFNMMQQGKALLFKSGSVLPFAPVVGLIPPYKLHQNKALIVEYCVGKGRLMMCTLKLDIDDPAAAYLKTLLVQYLAGENLADAPQVEPEVLAAAASGKFSTEAAISTDIAWDPNAGK